MTRLGEQVLHCASDGDDVRQGRLDADAPELSHVVLSRAARVVGRERDSLARGPQPLDRLDRAVDGLVAEPDAAVEVDDQLVVALDEGGEGHETDRTPPSLGFRAVLRYLTLLLTLLALVAAGCGDDDESDDGGDSGATAPTETQAETQVQKPKRQKQGGCVEVTQPDPKPDGGEEKPTEELLGETNVVFDTN